MRPAFTVVGLFMLLALAGCLDPVENPPGPDRGPMPQDPERPADDDGVAVDDDSNTTAAEVALDGVLQMTGCHWMGAARNYPYRSNPTPVPSDWDGDDPAPLTSNVFRLLQCSSFGLDHLDRPASLLLESSNHGLPPDECRTSERDVMFILNLFVDDEEIAAWMAEAYDAPVQVAEIHVESGMTETTWTWTSDGAASSLTYPEDEGEIQRNYGGIRLLWPSGNGTMQLDADLQFHGPPTSDRTAYGTLSDQHAYTAGPGGAFAGPGAGGSEGSLSGRLTRLGPGCAPLD